MASPEKSSPSPKSQPSSQPVATPSPEPTAPKKQLESKESKALAFKELKAVADEITAQLQADDLDYTLRNDLLVQSDKAARKLGTLAEIKNLGTQPLTISSEGENLIIYDPVLQESHGECAGEYSVKPDLTFTHS